VVVAEAGGDDRVTRLLYVTSVMRTPGSPGRCRRLRAHPFLSRPEAFAQSIAAEIDG
jgi:hypothetical protein